MSKLPLLWELLSSQVVEPYSAFRERICNICKNGKDSDVIALLFYLVFLNAAVKSLWIPVDNVDCQRSFSMYSCVMSNRMTNMTPDNMEMLSILVSD
ncbi:hypothetical protein PR048_028200 [Dryococelus australis]|uniref:Uncharacterized protein n=1 Tax=Dryococelus australis TaxID=614101 RepID=A0ABQ9GIK9_9NEOP|nr:hypothetical protein PR048_028200 [Dryococelus australis]